MQLISDYIKLFIQDRKVYCEDVTVQSYIFYLGRFTKWLDSDDFDLLNKQTLRDYIYSLRYRMNNTSIATNYRPVKAFCKWLYQEDYLDKDITIGVKLPKKDAAIVEPLTDQEVYQIDDTIINNSVNKHIALRNYCIFHLALDCGLRRKEIVQLHKMDIKFDRLIIHNAKNNKDRIVLLPRFLYFSLRNYYNESHYAHDYVKNSSSSVFLDMYDNEPITLNTIKCFYQDLKSLSGIDRIHGHLCRHTFATSFLQYGGDMEKLRLFMGHADYEILKNYLHLSLIYPDVYKLDDIFFKKPDT